MNLLTLFIIVAPFFSPNYGKGDCTAEIVKQIDAATNAVLVQAYNFTSPPIGAALAKAERAGVKVQVIVDKVSASQKNEQVSVCRAAGIPVKVDRKHKIQHNKVMIIDGHIVITGSFNFSTNAENGNAENLVVIEDKGIAKQYTENWETHDGHSEGVK